MTNPMEQTQSAPIAGASEEKRGLAATAVSSRRSFLGVLMSAAAASIGALLSVPLVRFFLHPALAAGAPSAWKELGEVKEFEAMTAPVKKLVKIEQRDGWRKVISDRPVYVCKDASGKLNAFSAVCPHLGCTIAWHDEKNGFACPCHNGQFTAEGKLMSGPPPRNMDTLDLKVDGDMVMVHYKNFRQLVPHKEEIA